jgi:L-asparaginase
MMFVGGFVSGPVSVSASVPGSIMEPREHWSPETGVRAESSECPLPNWSNWSGLLRAHQRLTAWGIVAESSAGTGTGTGTGTGIGNGNGNRILIGSGAKVKLTILTTGGTIDKTYDEYAGSLSNIGSVLDDILRSLRLPDVFIRHVAVMHKDSLDITEDDRRRILNAVLEAIPNSDAIIVLHGTDTLSKTGEVLHTGLADLDVPVIMTGAMRPYEFRDSDALQNVTEAMLAARLLEPGVYVIMHNRVLEFPGVVKDRQAGEFKCIGENSKTLEGAP